MGDESNYPIVTESRPSTYPEHTYKAVDEDWPSSRLEERIAWLLDTLEINSEIMVNEVDEKPIYYRRRRLHRHEVAEHLLQEVEERPDASAAYMWRVFRDLGIRITDNSKEQA